MTEIEQEIEWLKNEIDQDEHLRGSRDFTSFHEQRIAENKEKLSELLDSTSSSSECPQCGGERAWCDICHMWSSTCCEEYGTCECS